MAICSFRCKFLLRLWMPRPREIQSFEERKAMPHHVIWRFFGTLANQRRLAERQHQYSKYGYHSIHSRASTSEPRVNDESTMPPIAKGLAVSLVSHALVPSESKAKRWFSPPPVYRLCMFFHSHLLQDCYPKHLRQMHPSLSFP